MMKNLDLFENLDLFAKEEIKNKINYFNIDGELKSISCPFPSIAIKEEDINLDNLKSIYNNKIKLINGNEVEFKSLSIDFVCDDKGNQLYKETTLLLSEKINTTHSQFVFYERGYGGKIVKKLMAIYIKTKDDDENNSFEDFIKNFNSDKSELKYALRALLKTYIFILVKDRFSQFKNSNNDYPVTTCSLNTKNAECEFLIIENKNLPIIKKDNKIYLTASKSKKYIDNNDGFSNSAEEQQKYAYINGYILSFYMKLKIINNENIIFYGYNASQVTRKIEIKKDNDNFSIKNGCFFFKNASKAKVVYREEYLNFTNKDKITRYNILNITYNYFIDFFKNNKILFKKQIFQPEVIYNNQSNFKNNEINCDIKSVKTLTINVFVDSYFKGKTSDYIYKELELYTNDDKSPSSFTIKKKSDLLENQIKYDYNRNIEDMLKSIIKKEKNTNVKINKVCYYSNIDEFEKLILENSEPYLILMKETYAKNDKESELKSRTNNKNNESSKKQYNCLLTKETINENNEKILTEYGFFNAISFMLWKNITTINDLIKYRKIDDNNKEMIDVYSYIKIKNILESQDGKYPRPSQGMFLEDDLFSIDDMKEDGIYGISVNSSSKYIKKIKFCKTIRELIIKDDLYQIINNKKNLNINTDFINNEKTLIIENSDIRIGVNGENKKIKYKILQKLFFKKQDNYFVFDKKNKDNIFFQRQILNLNYSCLDNNDKEYSKIIIGDISIKIESGDIFYRLLNRNTGKKEKDKYINNTKITRDSKAFFPIIPISIKKYIKNNKSSGSTTGMFILSGFDNISKKYIIYLYKSTEGAKEKKQKDVIPLTIEITKTDKNKKISTIDGYKIIGSIIPFMIFGFEIEKGISNSTIFIKILDNITG